MHKFALVSHGQPPGPSGQALVIYRLLVGLEADSYCLISEQSNTWSEPYSDPLPGQYYHLPPVFQAPPTLARWLRRPAIVLGALGNLLPRASGIASIVRHEGCQAIIACTGGDMLNLPAGYLASRRARVPFYVYIFDDYANQSPPWRPVARRLEPMLLKRAAGIIVPNESMHDALLHRHGLEATVIHNPCDLSLYEAWQHGPEPVSSRQPPDEVRIVYTGEIGGAQAGAMRTLVEAIERLGHLNVRLHLYSARAQAKLVEWEIQGPVVYHKPELVKAMPDIQRQADILFLPLAFDAPYPELIRTSAPSKIGEYLAARRPVLVYAPADSFIATYFRRYECGLVVDKPDPAWLARAIDHLLSDADLRRKLTARAWERAQVDFSLSTARAKFMAVIGLDQAREQAAC